MKKSKFRTKILAFLVLTCFMAGCDGAAWEGWGTWDGEVISREQSPGGKVDAIIVEGSLGATTGFSHRIYLVIPGTEFNNTSEIFDSARSFFRAAGVQGLTIKWIDPETLEISYESARIFHFSNFVDHTDADQKITRYNIKLIETPK